MDSVASTNTTKEESTHVSPQYDSSEEWEIGLGNLIIDLDADLEKDRQDGSGGGGNNAGGTPADSSPLRIGKMKIKRKVSTNTATGGPKGPTVEGASPRKDSLSSTDENSQSATAAVSPTQPERMVKEEKVSVKSGGRNVNNSGSVSSTGGPHSKHEPIVTTGKHSVVTGGSTKAAGSITVSSGDIHGKYSSGNSHQDKDTMDNNICRIKPSAALDHNKPQTVCKKEKETASSGGGRKKDEKEGKEATGKKGGDGSTKKQKKRGEKVIIKMFSFYSPLKFPPPRFFFSLLQVKKSMF